MKVVSDFQMCYCRDQFYLIAHLQRHVLREGSGAGGVLWKGGGEIQWAVVVQMV